MNNSMNDSKPITLKIYSVILRCLAVILFVLFVLICIVEPVVGVIGIAISVFIWFRGRNI